MRVGGGSGGGGLGFAVRYSTCARGHRGHGTHDKLSGMTCREGGGEVGTWKEWDGKGDLDSTTIIACRYEVNGVGVSLSFLLISHSFCGSELNQPYILHFFCPPSEGSSKHRGD